MTTTESYGCDKHGEDAYQGCAMCDLETLRERLHEAELVAASWKREAELNEQAADESSGYAKRLAEAERNEETLLGMIRHQRDVLRECLPYINESMAGRRPGRSADDIRAAVKALTSDSASVCLHQIHNGDTCEICGAKVTPVVQPERCCVDYPRCDCNSPPEPDNAPTLQPCGHPWKAQHNFKCILCSSPG